MTASTNEQKIVQHQQFGGVAEIRAPKQITGVANLTASKLVLSDGSKNIVSSTLAEADIVTASNTKTFTNKSFDANGTGNSITNIETADLAAGVLSTSLSGDSTDAQVASAKAAYDFATSAANTAQSNAESYADDAASTAQSNAESYADGLVVGLWDDRGNFDASSNTFPTTGGSGTEGDVLKGDIWTISVAGTLGGHAVTAGDTVRALVDAPGSTDANWALGENNTGYVVENQANKSTDIAADTGSDVKYPSVAAVETYGSGILSDANSYTDTGVSSANSYTDSAISGVTLANFSTAITFSGEDFVATTDDVLTISAEAHGFGSEISCIFYEDQGDGTFKKISVSEVLNEGDIILTLPLTAAFDGKVIVSKSVAA